MRQTPQMPEPAKASPAGPVADAVQGNWVDTLAPAPLRPFLRLSRADRPVGTWLLWLPCLWALALAGAAKGGFDGHDLWLALSSGLGAFLMRGAGCTWNDYTDRTFDAAVARTKSRPLPSGQVTPRQALLWMGLQAGVAALILFSYTPLAIGLGIASLALVAIYPFAKRFTWWPQVFLGLAFNWGALLIWAAQSGRVTAAAVALYLAGLVWTLFYDTIYAHQDKEDDALIGVKSTARLFAERTPQWLLAFLVVTLVCLAAAVWLALAPRGSLPALLLGLAGVAAFGLHLVSQMRQLDIGDPQSCLRIFRSNREAGLTVALFLAACAYL